jgi:formyltetrahydrofolate synthetase
VQVEAAQLLADFESNEAAADLKYKGKSLQVTGHVAKVDTELFNKDQYVVRLDDGGPYSILSVNCNGISATQAAAVVADSTITVRGMFQDGGDLGVEIKGCEVL